MQFVTPGASANEEIANEVYTCAMKHGTPGQDGIQRLAITSENPYTEAVLLPMTTSGTLLVASRFPEMSSIMVDDPKDGGSVADGRVDVGALTDSNDGRWSREEKTGIEFRAYWQQLYANILFSAATLCRELDKSAGTSQ